MRHGWRICLSNSFPKQVLESWTKSMHRVIEIEVKILYQGEKNPNKVICLGAFTSSTNSSTSFPRPWWGVLQDNLVLSTGLIMWIGHRKEIRKVTFRALALGRARREWVRLRRANARNVSFRISSPPAVANSSTQLIKPNYLKAHETTLN